MSIILIIIWFAVAVSIIPTITVPEDISMWTRLALTAVVLFGAPFILIGQAINIIIDGLLPEGWSDDEDGY